MYDSDTKLVLAETGITTCVRKQDKGDYALVMKSSKTDDEPFVTAKELAFAKLDDTKVQPRPPGIPTGSAADVIAHQRRMKGKGPKPMPPPQHPLPQQWVPQQIPPHMQMMQQQMAMMQPQMQMMQPHMGMMPMIPQQIPGTGIPNTPPQTSQPHPPMHFKVGREIVV